MKIKTMAMAAAVTTLAGCGGEGSGSAWAGTVVDSAGVQVVHNPMAGVWGAEEGWTVEEVFRVGGMDASTESQFSFVIGVDVDEQGRVYVADQQSRQIQVFNADGSHALSVGQPGDGPGEFGQALSGVFVDGGVIRAPDMTNQRVNLYSLDGTPTGSIPFSMADGIPLRWDEAATGELVIQRRGVASEGMAALEEGDPISTLPAEGESRVLATLPQGQSFRMENGAPTFRIFDPEPMWDVAGDGRLARAMNSEYRVELWSPESLERIITRPVTPVEVTEAEERRILDMTRELMIGQGAPPQAAEQVLQQMQFADNYPAFAQLLLGSDGHLWVQRIRTSRDVPEGEEWSPQDLGSHEWDVFDSEGRYLGIMELPLRFQPLREVDGVLWGIQRDEFDVQAVVGLRVVRS